MRKKISIEGMSCEHCVRHVTSALEELSGVRNVEVNLSAQSAVIESDTDIKDSDIKLAIEDAGYDVMGIQEA